jgi:hypothetical protein
LLGYTVSRVLAIACAALERRNWPVDHLNGMMRAMAVVGQLWTFALNLNQSCDQKV